MAKVNNPRFPHTCVIYHMEGVTSLSPEGFRTEVYNGTCRKSSSGSIRSFNSGSLTMGKVDTADARISLPGVVKGIKAGSFVEVTDITDEITRYRIVSVEHSLLFGGSTSILAKTSSN